MILEFNGATRKSTIIHQPQAWQYLRDFFPINTPIAIFIDDQLQPYQYQPYLECYPKANYRLIPSGESVKDLSVYTNLIDQLIEWQLHRDSWIIVIGGGTLSDLIGFVAATYLRGINLISIPTTTLSQIDASIGGKVALNHQYKNLIGTFYQPNLVLIDPNWLSTLPLRHYYNGLYEGIKTYLLSEPASLKLFEDLPNNLTTIINHCLQYKLQIVQQDEFDQGLRSRLNFGHTIAHALETIADDNLLHGEAVMHGIMMMCDHEPLRHQLQQIAKQWQLPPVQNATYHNVLAKLVMDKKNSHQGLNDTYIDKNQIIRQRNFTYYEYWERINYE
jgi:3-dehydroquinate synthase